MLKKFHSLFLVIPMACVFMNTAFATGLDFSKLVIFHTNDTHGYDEYNEKNGNMGMAAIAQIRKDYMDNGYNVLLADAGDFSQDNILVNFSEGHAAVEFMKYTGYDVATVGNHDFYYGQENLLKYAEEALKFETDKSSFPIITCNVVNKDTQEYILTPRTTIQKGDLKIGVVGITTPETTTSTTPSSVADLDFLSYEALYAVVQNQVTALENDGCDLIIALGHLGNQEALAGNRSKDVIANVSGIDIFIDGHDHAIVNGEYVADKDGKEILLAEAGDHTEYLGMITFVDGKWVENLIPFSAGMSQDQNVAGIIAAERERIEALNRVIGRSDFELMGANKICRTEETNLSDLYTDALLWQAKRKITDSNFRQNMLVIQNTGGIRASIEAGNITANDVASAFPYENSLFCVQVKGSAVLEMLEAACQAENEGAFPCIANAKVSFNKKVPYVKGQQYPNSVFFAPANPGARIKIYEIDGQPFDSEKIYNLVCNGFMLEGGDAYGVLVEEGTVISSALIDGTASETLMEYIMDELGGVIPVKYNAPQGRFVTVGVYDVDSPSTKSLTETRATGMALLNTASELATGKGFASAQAAAAASNGFTPYVAAGGSDMRYDTGSHVNSEGWGINVGFARIINKENSKMTMAPFVEYGKFNYDSYLDNGVHGSGDSRFAGVGFMAKNEEKNGLYYEGSIRLGRSKGDYNGEWHLGKYDTESNYAALHAGIGRVQKISGKNSIDHYAKFFYTHQYGDDVTVKRPEIGDSFVYNFDAINSYRLRLGTRLISKFKENDSIFFGLAYEREFDSEARGQCQGVGTPSPSMKGSSRMLELGWKKEATSDNPFGAEVSLTGWRGKQRGISFNAGFSFSF